MHDIGTQTLNIPSTAHNLPVLRTIGTQTMHHTTNPAPAQAPSSPAPQTKRQLRAAICSSVVKSGRFTCTQRHKVLKYTTALTHCALRIRTPVAKVWALVQSALEAGSQGDDYYYPSDPVVSQGPSANPADNTIPTTQLAHLSMKDIQLPHTSPAHTHPNAPSVTLPTLPIPTKSYHTQHAPPTTIPYKPIGPAGYFPVPSDLLPLHPSSHSLSLSTHQDCTPYEPPPIPPYDPILCQVTQDLLAHGLINLTHTSVPEVDSHIPVYHASPFLLPKSSVKLSLILNFHSYNIAQSQPPAKFTLPSTYSIRAQLLDANLSGHSYYFTTLDISNFYWSLDLPFNFLFPVSQPDSTIQFYSISRLPFGWDYAPFLGQSTLRRLVSEVPSPTCSIDNTYIDDILLGHSVPQILHTWTSSISNHLVDSGLLISPKSVVEPQVAVNYIGKRYSARAIANTQARLTSLLRSHWNLQSLPYISPSYLAKHTGQLAHSISHHSSYSPLHYLNLCLSHRQYIKPNVRLRSAMAKCLAYANTPWDLFGLFWHPHGASRPHIYVDASLDLVGLVFPGPLSKGWLATSKRLPSSITKLPTPQRQQAAELYGLLLALRLAHRRHISDPCIVQDNSGSLGTGVKGSTATFPTTRPRILAAIQHHLIRHRTLCYVAFTESENMPADIPSRQQFSVQPATQEIIDKLTTLELFPGLIAYSPTQFEELTHSTLEVNSGAWATPISIREIIAHAPFPPTYDLFAHPRTAITPQYSSAFRPVSQHTFTLTTTTGAPHTWWYQPPYDALLSTLRQLLPHLHTTQCWGLLPYTFLPTLMTMAAHHTLHHVCSSQPLIVHFIPPGHAPGPGSLTPAPFYLVLVFMGPRCMCNWIHLHTHTHIHYC